MCRKIICHTYRAGTLRRMAAIDMLLRWSKVRVLVIVLDDMCSTRCPIGILGLPRCSEFLPVLYRTRVIISASPMVCQTQAVEVHSTPLECILLALNIL